MFRKACKLSSPHSDPPFEMLGGGTATFDRKAGVFRSLDFKQVFVLKRGNASFEMPVQVTYRLLTAEEIAAVEEAARKAREESARRMAELEAKRAEEEAEAKAPVEGEERQHVLAALMSEDKSAIIVGVRGRSVATAMAKSALEAAGFQIGGTTYKINGR